MRRGIAVGLLLIAMAGWTSPSRADFVVSIGSTSIAQGGTGTIDVFLTSTASSSAPDLLNNLGFQLQITGPSFLEFSSSQNFSYLNASNYVFFGDSNDSVTSSPGGIVSTSFYTNDTFSGIDTTYSGNPISLNSSNTPVLLAVLTLDATNTNAGDSYTIGLVPPTGDGSINTNSVTYFDNYSFNTGTETSAVPYTSTPGTVTIIAASIPEPSSIIMGLSGVALLAARSGFAAGGGPSGSRADPPDRVFRSPRRSASLRRTSIAHPAPDVDR